MRRAIVLAALLVATPAVAAESHLVVVAGLGGDPQFRDLFHEQAVALASAAETRFGLAAENVYCLTEKPERDPTTIDQRSTLEHLTSVFEELTARVRPGDRVFVLLIGHGSFRSGEGRFNLPGPDLTPSGLARLLEPLDEQEVVLVSTASASGAFAEPLAGPGRVVVTATKSGQERNQTMFGEHFVTALTTQGADVDKDGRVSILEAYAYTTREVERFYESENRLQTEHARLEDEGQLARRLFLQGEGHGGAEEETASADPALASLYAARRDLEDRIETLRAGKDEIAPESYAEQLEALLLELALQNESIDAAGGKR
ncbi:MAG: hypothetical protein PVJ73_05755 [Acidobacteriota bacterium]